MQQVSSTLEPRLPRLLTIEEVAELTKVSTSRLYALIKEGTLPAVTFGRAKRIRPEDLEEFIRSNLTA